VTNPVDLIVVIPVGPNEVLEYILDTIDSVTHYMGLSTKIIVADDSGTDTGAAVQSRVPGVDLVKTPRLHGGQGGLYLTLSLAYLHAARNYEFKVLLKLDVDALVTGDRPDVDAIRFFDQHPDVGIIGLYGHGTQPDVDDHHWSKSRLLEETRGRSALRDPILCFTLRRLLRRARRHGFRPGDYIFGGSYFMSSACVRRLADANLLSRQDLGRSLLEEDHIFGLLAKTVGVELADFASGDLPMALELKRLPYAPAELVAKKKKVAHSVRRWQGLGEAEIRTFFRDLRTPNVRSRVTPS
jgi:glycosyltransferase involved in cell wall biosynthesis